MDPAPPFFPQEIITNILVRLPVKSLIRFLCVCKQWKNLIEDQSFMEDHLHRSNQESSLLFERNLRGKPLLLYLIDRHMKLLEVLSVPIKNPLWRLSVVDSTNGLICVKFYVTGLSLPSFLLWNPATRQARLVPDSNLDFRGNCHAAFGFSPIANDYKILMIHYDDEEDEDEDEDESESESDSDDGFVGLIFAEVYSLSNDSWKEVEYDEIFKPVSQTVTVNGLMFCFGLGHDEGEICLISFDLAAEDFSWIPVPVIDCDQGFDLVELDNKLAIAAQTCCANSKSCVFNLWVMEEAIGASEERWKWTKKYTVTFSSGLLFPTCIWKDELVGIDDKIPAGVNSEAECEEEKMQNEAMTVISVVNFITKESRYFPFNERFSYNSALFSYAESLVPIGPH